jgi:YfiH family protein
MEYYDLGRNITAFTTDRTIGRDASQLLAELPVAARGLLYPHQTHTDSIAVIDAELLSLSATEQKQRLEGVDAIISSERGIALGISTADCIPVLIYDPVHHAAAAIHAGWKGTVRRIVEKTLDQMRQTYGTTASECTAAIGPGISIDSFEVGQEVVDIFLKAGFEMHKFSRMYPPMKLDTNGMAMRPHIDLKEINRMQLLAKGVKAENITVSVIDTYTDLRFFSARREQLPPAPDGTIVKCGRILSGFVLHAY